MTGNLAMGGNKVTGLAASSSNGDAVRHEQLAALALDSAVMKLSGNQTAAGIKTFSSIPVLPASNPTTDNQAARKAYVDTKVAASTTYSGTGNAIEIINNSSGRGVYVNNTSNGYGMRVNNVNNGNGMFVENTGTGLGVSVTNTSTGLGVYVINKGTGYGVYAESTTTSSSRKPIAKFVGSNIVIPYISTTTTYNSANDAINALHTGTKENGSMVALKYNQSGQGLRYGIFFYIDGAWKGNLSG